MEKEAPPPYVPPGYAPPPQHGGIYPPGAYPPPPQPGYPQPGYPQPGYPQAEHPQPVLVTPAPQVEHTVIVTTTSPPHMYGPTPMGITCPYCHAAIVTSVETEANTKTHLFAFLLFIFGCWLCCCLPYCMDSCQSKKHYCPNCKAYLAEYSS